jgi:predicted O-linked N-acetylglucosamine transferase (SPINDLY family)
VIEVWSQLLRRVPRSRLLLKNKSLADVSTRDRLVQSFAEQGIAAERLLLRGEIQSHDEHLALYHQLDIALDTFPYNGTTTTCEALWMGVPVIALAGQGHMSRVGVSILSSVGLGEFIAQTPEEYVTIAAELAGDLPRLQTLRAGLRERLAQSPLLDAAGFARAMETAYRAMWRKWCGT